ncbi:MAG: RNA methyltransferase [Acidobacteria bacterium]|nr:MAG: RNA methyltransferase [Acidobacteriota bacterium]
MSPPLGRPEPIIGSPQNARVRLARSLERDRAARDRSRTYLAWGIHLAQEALAAGAEVREAFVAPGLEQVAEGRGLLERLRGAGVPLARATRRILESIVEGSGDQGIVMLVRRPERDLPGLMASRPTLLVAAHGVQDPGNLGSILRTARALGAEALLALPGCADPFGSRAVRAAMGAQFTLPVACADAPSALAALRRAGVALVAADPAGAERPTEIDLRRPAAILVGSEGGGLPPPILEAADHRVRIPMAPGVGSLNVHAAAAALLYEAARQRGFRFR